jgi:hypothetical protein
VKCVPLTTPASHSYRAAELGAFVTDSMFIGADPTGAMSLTKHSFALVL